MDLQYCLACLPVAFKSEDTSHICSQINSNDMFCVFVLKHIHN